ncbi:MAG: SBBP repeat-containing protein, partial [Anaerolineae bacterium]|nr:SBBP repeat-containing protein [Anaerolineae bacterium]
EPFNRLDTQLSTFYGSDPSRWQTDIPVWGGVRYRDLYPGFDLEVSGENGQWRWQLVSNQNQVANKTSPPADVQLRVEGAQALSTDSNSILLTTALGDFKLPLLPLLDQNNTLLTAQTTPPSVVGSIITAPFAPALPPDEPTLNATSGQFSQNLIYSTYLGGANQDDFGQGIEVNALGEVYVVGGSEAADLPTTPGAVEETYQGNRDAFIIKLNAAGTNVLFATYIGGGGRDDGFEVELDGSDNIYLAGRTNSTDFPTTGGAFQTTPQGDFDSFVVKLNPTGNSLVYSTYLGGNEFDDVYDLDLDTAGNAYLVGTTFSPNYPTLLAVGSYAGQADAYVTKLSTDGASLLFSSLLGGIDVDTGFGLALDSSNNVYVAGQTSSANFPVTATAYDTSYNENGDAFIAKLSSTGTVLLYATFVGGSGYDDAFALEADDSGAVFVMGEASEDFPVTLGAFDTQHSGAGDAHALVIDTTQAGADGLIYASYIGGSGEDWGNDVKLDLANGRYFVMGYTQSSDFPVTANALNSARASGTSCGPADDPAPCGDAFVIEFTSNGTGLANSTFLGGSREDAATDLALDSANNLYLTGLTASLDFPTTAGVFNPTPGGGSCGEAPNTRDCFDAFVSKLTVTRIVTSVTLSPGSSATLVSNDPNASTTIEFPAGSVTATTVVTYAYQLSLPPLPLAQIDHTFSLVATQGGLPLTTLDQPFTMTVRYTDDEVSDIRDDSLNFYRLSPNVWRTTDITPAGQSANQLSATTTKLGTLAVFGKARLFYFPIIFRN